MPSTRSLLTVPASLDRHQHLDLAQHVERSALSGLWHSEQCYETLLYSQLSLMATDRIRSGTAISARNKRHPVQAAQAVSTIDHLSGGRFVFGLGTGVYKPYSGVADDRIVARMGEYVDIVRAVLTGEPVEVHGNFYDAVFGTGEDVLDFVPSSPLPIHIAAGGPLMQRLAGRKGDGVFLHFGSRAAFREQIDTVRGAAVEAGRDPAAVRVNQLTPLCIDEDGEAARTSLRRYFSDFYFWRPFYLEQLTSAGFVTEAEEIGRARAAGDVEAAALAMTDEMLDEFALAGTAADVADRFDDFFVEGVDEVLLYPSPSDYRVGGEGDWLGIYLRSIDTFGHAGS